MVCMTKCWETQVSILDHVSPPKKMGHHHRTDVTGSTQAQAVCGWWAWLSGRGGGEVAIRVAEEGGKLRKTAEF
jgi:hypothetical protein